MWLDGFGGAVSDLVVICALIGAGVGIATGVWKGVSEALGFRDESPKKALTSPRGWGRARLAGDLFLESLGWAVWLGPFGALCGAVVGLALVPLGLLPIFLVMS